MADALLEENRTKNGGPNSVSQTFVGTDGIMMKSTTMDVIKSYDTLDDEGTILESSSYVGIAKDEMPNEEEVELPKIQYIVATKSAEAGINGKFLEFGKMNGIPSSKYELVQALGRVDREGKASPGSNTYQIHADAYSHTSQFVRVMKCPCREERKIEMAQLDEIMVMLFVPNMCYHRAIEIYFEWEKYPNKTDCGNYCTKCKNKVKDFTKRVRKEGVQSVLCDKVDGKKVSATAFIKLLKKNKDIIFHKDDVPKNKKVGQIHALFCSSLQRASYHTMSKTTRR